MENDLAIPKGLTPRSMFEDTQTAVGFDAQEQDGDKFNNSIVSSELELRKRLQAVENQRAADRRTYEREMQNARQAIHVSQQSLESVTTKMQQDFEEQFVAAQNEWKARDSEKQKKIEDLERELGSTVVSVQETYEKKAKETATLNEKLQRATDASLESQRKCALLEGQLEEQKRKYEDIKNDTDSTLTSWSLERRALEQQVANLDTALKASREHEEEQLTRIRGLEERIQEALKEKAHDYTVVVERDEFEKRCSSLEKQKILQQEEIVQLQSKVSRLSMSLKYEKQRSTELENDLNLEKLRNCDQLSSSVARFSIGNLSSNSNGELTPEQLELERSIANWKKERLDLEIKTSALKESLSHSRIVLSKKDIELEFLRSRVDKLEETCKSQSLQLSRAGTALERSARQLSTSIPTAQSNVAQGMMKSSSQLSSTVFESETTTVWDSHQMSDKDEMVKQLLNTQVVNLGSHDTLGQGLMESRELGTTNSRKHSNSVEEDASNTSLSSTQLHEALDAVENAESRISNIKSPFSESNRIIDRILNSSASPTSDIGSPKGERSIAKMAPRTEQEEYLENLIERFLGDEESDSNTTESHTKVLEPQVTTVESRRNENLQRTPKPKKTQVSKVAQAEKKRVLARTMMNRQRQQLNASRISNKNTASKRPLNLNSSKLAARQNQVSNSRNANSLKDLRAKVRTSDQRSSRKVKSKEPKLVNRRSMKVLDNQPSPKRTTKFVPQSQRKGVTKSKLSNNSRLGQSLMSRTESSKPKARRPRKQFGDEINRKTMKPIWR